MVIFFSSNFFLITIFLSQDFLDKKKLRQKKFRQYINLDKIMTIRYHAVTTIYISRIRIKPVIGKMVFVLYIPSFPRVSHRRDFSRPACYGNKWNVRECKWIVCSLFSTSHGNKHQLRMHPSALSPTSRQILKLTLYVSLVQLTQLRV